VNYVGHAAVASWTTREPVVLLAAMLPDLATMCGARLAPAEAQPDAAIARGIALHEATDAAFHRLPAATALMRELDELLARGGCARGPRRAVAHVGTELLLDGVYVEDVGYREAYVAAIAAEPAAVAWRGDGEAGASGGVASARLAHVLARMRGFGVPDDLRDPELVTARLARILAPRPLLAPTADDLRAIRAALIAYRPRVEVAAATVLHGLRAILNA
jgi:hypothetical protein